MIRDLWDLWAGEEMGSEAATKDWCWRVLVWVCCLGEELELEFLVNIKKYKNNMKKLFAFLS